MNIQINFSKSLMMLASLMIIFYVSCSKKYPENVESPDKVVLESIKIVNGGANGNEVIEGVVDEFSKTVTFPRLDTNTNFSAIKFEAVLSNGAKLDKDVYQFNFGSGVTRNSQIIKVMNNERFREYQVTLRLNVPVYGADFEKPSIFDYSNNSAGKPTYPTFSTGLTRGSGFDGEHVLIVTRAPGGSHLLKTSDLRNNTVAPISLNLTGVSGGTFPVNVGAQVNGHTYISNLSGNSAASPLKIYHWASPTDAPQLIWSGVIAGGGARLGDNMSANLDENGNGYFFFGDNAATKVVRLTVTNYTTISDPVAFTGTAVNTYTMSMNRVGYTADYIYTGYSAPIRVANESTVISYTLGSDDVPVRGSDAHVVNFNQERYLIMTTSARSGSEPTVLYVYNITNGSNVTDALKIFNDKADKSPVYQYSLGGSATANCFVQTRYSISKDEQGNDKTLTIYSAHTDAGFVVIDFPIKVQED